MTSTLPRSFALTFTALLALNTFNSLSYAQSPLERLRPSFSSTDFCRQVPAWECRGGEAQCGKLGVFDPRKAFGYWNYPKNGETAKDLYRSYARKDLISLVRYATAYTYCATRNWKTGIGGPLGLGDMSERDGSIPGTRVGRPGHPKGTHVHGKDMDIAYYQKRNSDNKMRPICPHKIKGRDEHRCVSEPTNLDLDRTALFIARLHDNPNLRVVGVDGKIGDLVKGKIQQMCADGSLGGNACQNLKLAYEPKNTGRGWFLHHHHHLHVSLDIDRHRPKALKSTVSTNQLCITTDCSLETE